MSDDAATTKSTVGQQEATNALIESVKTLNVDQNCADHDNDDPTCSSTAVEDDGVEGLVVETKVQEASTNTNTNTVHQQVQHVKAKVSTSTNKGGRVSARAQWLTNQAFHKDRCHHHDKTSSPIIHANHTTTPMRRGKVGAKMKWLESAFSKENDGKNMADNQDDEVVVQSSPSTVLNKGAATTTTSTTSSMSTAAVQIRTSPRSNSNSPAKYLDKRNDSMTWAYEVWYKKGMLTWRPTCLQNQVSTE